MELVYKPLTILVLVGLLTGKRAIMSQLASTCCSFFLLWEQRNELNHKHPLYVMYCFMHRYSTAVDSR